MELRIVDFEKLSIHYKKYRDGLNMLEFIKSEYLKQHVIDDKIVANFNEEAAVLIEKAELEIKNLKNIIFDGRVLIFERNDEMKINDSILP